MLTNPATAIEYGRTGLEAIVEYVNDWRDAIKVMLPPPAASGTRAPAATLAASGAGGGAEKV